MDQADPVPYFSPALRDAQGVKATARSELPPFVSSLATMEVSMLPEDVLGMRVRGHSGESQLGGFSYFSSTVRSSFLFSALSFVLSCQVRFDIEGRLSY
jgi:hypothetical protein